MARKKEKQKQTNEQANRANYMESLALTDES